MGTVCAKQNTGIGLTDLPRKKHKTKQLASGGVTMVSKKKAPNADGFVTPPFPAISSFNVAAIILSYTNYKDDVRQFITPLSKAARDYYEKH